MTKHIYKLIYDLSPAYIHDVETHGGGAKYTFMKPWDLIEGRSEILNDLDGELTNFYTVLQYKPWFEEFLERIILTPFSKPLWENAAENYKKGCPINRAVLFFIKYRQSRMGLGKDFATMTRNRVRRGMNEQVSSWLSAIEGLPEAHKRFQRVVITNEDATGLVKREDGHNTLFYSDLPYLPSTRQSVGQYGEFEMTEKQHADYLELLGSLKGKFILSGYPSELYEGFEKRFGWNRREILIDNKSSSAKKKEKKTECLWYNF